MYHWENDQEDFLVLAGEALLIVEGRERPLRQWDFVHCPPGTRHVFVGAGDGPCAVLAIGARENVDKDCHGGAYVADEVAARYARASRRTRATGASRTPASRRRSRCATATAGFRSSMRADMTGAARKMHVDEVEINAALVGRLVAVRFPQVDGPPIEPVPNWERTTRSTGSATTWLCAYRGSAGPL
jgi:hypothetical protein